MALCVSGCVRVRVCWRRNPSRKYQPVCAERQRNVGTQNIRGDGHACRQRHCTETTSIRSYVISMLKCLVSLIVTTPFIHVCTPVFICMTPFSCYHHSYCRYRLNLVVIVIILNIVIVINTVAVVSGKLTQHSS